MCLSLSQSPSVCLLLLLLLGVLLDVRRLLDQGRSVNERSRLFQLLLAAVEFGRQGNADRPRIFPCSFVKGATL